MPALDVVALLLSAVLLACGVCNAQMQGEGNSTLFQCPADEGRGVHQVCVTIYGCRQPFRRHVPATEALCQASSITLCQLVCLLLVHSRYRHATFLQNMNKITVAAMVVA